MRNAFIWLIVLYLAGGSARSQDSVNPGDVRSGHALAVQFCSLCHVAARDQYAPPILRPPAPSFDTIAQRETTNADSIGAFLTTTHQGLDNPNGMSNPRLQDYEVRQVTAYLLSLRKNR